MIDKIYVEGLKSIHKLTVNCSKFNLFAGTNSSGKSTFLQAILIASQDDINGPLVSLGSFREARNYNMSGEDIKIAVWGDGKEKPGWISFAENAPDSYRTETSCMEFIINRRRNREEAESRMWIPEYGENLFFLSCDRTGVSDIYEKNISGADRFGIRGEYALSYLLNHESDPVDETVEVYNTEYTNSLLDQVNYWMSYIVGTVLQINDLKKTNYLQVKYNNNPMITSEAMYCRPVNVGSGISYLISMIVMCLAAKKNDIIIIENPEIHLHPKAQSRLCRFLYFIARADRQIFVETHSDHIFNGLRVGVAAGKIEMKDLSVNFFALDDHYETQCNPVVFGEYGKITGQNDDMDLKDLFDQFELDLDHMLGI